MNSYKVFSSKYYQSPCCNSRGYRSVIFSEYSRSGYLLFLTISTGREVPWHFFEKPPSSILNTQSSFGLTPLPTLELGLASPEPSAPGRPASPINKPITMLKDSCFSDSNISSHFLYKLS